MAFKFKKGKDKAPASPRGAQRKTTSSENIKRTPGDSKTKSSPAIGNSREAKPSPQSKVAPSSTKKNDNDDDFWGTEKPASTSSPQLGGMASPPFPSQQLAIPPGYMFQGFALDQYGQTVMVMVNAMTRQQFYQPVNPALVQQYTGYQSGQGSPMTPHTQPAYPPSGFQGGTPSYGAQPPSFGSPSFYPSGGSGFGQPPTGYSPQSNGGVPQGGYVPPSGGYQSPQATPMNPQGGSYGQPSTVPTGYPQQNGGVQGGSYVQQGSGYSSPQTNPMNPQGGSYVQPGTGYPSPQVDPRGRSASFDVLPTQPPVEMAPLNHSSTATDAPVPVPPRPAHLQNRTPTMKREILLNQHKFGEDFGKLSIMREARRKARQEEKKKTGGIKVLPTIKNPVDRKEQEKKRKEAIKKAEEDRRKREIEAKIQRDAEEKARLQEEAMLREVEEKVRREEAERRRAWEEEQLRLKAAEEKSVQEEAELHRRRLEEQRKQEEEQKALKERIEKEKSWAKQSFNPEAFRKQMELKLREEMEKQLKEEQERLRKSETMVWEVKPEDVTTDKPLGKGAFGMVYSGKLRGKRVAIKTILVENLNDENIASFKKEVDIMTKLRHPNILLFMGACFQPGHFMLITELMPKGSLDRIIHEKKEPLTFKQRINLARDTALGMNWLHSLTPPLLHLDLKLGNLLVDEGWNVKVADFGLSKMKSDCVTEDEGFIGSPFYMAPEMLQEKEYNEKADVYSFGIVLWELYTQRTPYEGLFNSLEEFIDAIVVDEERPDMPPNTPITLQNLIESCWQTDPDQRPTFTRILEASLFDCIIIEELVKDPIGRTFWMERLLEQDVVSWDDFLDSYCDYFHIDIDVLSATTAKGRALKAALVPHGKSSVTLEAFGNCLEWFGPLERTGLRLLENAYNTISQPWFHGEMTREEAELQLKPKKEGTYLIRFSASTPGSFTLSIKHQKKKFVHLRISRTPDGMFEYNKQAYPSISEFLQAHKGQLNLKTPCSGSPFQDISGKPSHVGEQGDEQYTNAEYGNFGQITFS